MLSSGLARSRGEAPTLFLRPSCEKVAPSRQFEIRLSSSSVPSMTDGLSTLYQDLLSGSYDCVDRIVLNAYFRMGHSPGGFRVWFGDATRENVGKPFAIVLDNKVISAPVIREPILGGSGIISGSFTVGSANDLALLLRAGALPAPLVILEERTVGPDLGADSIHAGTLACVVGVVLVVIFMVLFYGLFGAFADIALFFNLALLLA